ncbi:1,4-alpha-glucan branching protein domain-containing protein [Pseudonocardia sp. HH130630-07]|uniref:1,4-alpha-glucan branching protein domain-containing protein n=1 Tax=Pseudonocardia sp. HH130630-07 TaxID=1690815 RepID=UPI000814C3F7|nr:glycoside hydrolase family 57 protein [Pseudonocardia sp. HH130630-07]ANY05672.1 1,4-alpha-glucan branching protein [Pseudonocardia sp. HH130630-07]
MTTAPVGTFCLVLHSHLPLLARHGRWPVGEEWLYQSWAHSYLPVVATLRELAAEGRTGLATLGVTPVLAAQLDDPYCLRGAHDWLGDWTLRAHSAAGRLPELAAHEHRVSTAATAEFEAHWRHGGSPALRALRDSGAVELLGGPAAHPFQPLLAPRVRGFSLRAGLADHALRLGSRPAGIWAPECGYAPGMEHDYAAAGVERFLVDGPALRGDTALARPVGDSGVLCVGRDLDVTYRVWSPRRGYPGSPEYRDFHTWDHASGLKPARVTGRRVPSEAKRPYSPELAAGAVQRDARDFVDTVVARLHALRSASGRPALTVAAFDTELFGHWWHEGPDWLAAVLRLLPAAGVAVRTLGGAVSDGLVGDPVTLPECSWGSGKDWRVWTGPQVADFVSRGDDVQRALLSAVDTVLPGSGPLLRRDVRDPLADLLVDQALHALSSDWAFMVSKDSAADYAHARSATHAGRVGELSGLLRAGRRRAAERRSAHWDDARSPLFGHVDARDLAAPPTTPG